MKPFKKFLWNPLIGIIFISFGAFLGFGSLFRESGLNIGVEALTAAFGALFIILSTKFLMDRENQNEIANKRSEKVFQLRIEELQQSIKLLKNLDEHNLTLSALSDLQAQSRKLALCCSRDTIQSFSEVHQKCIDIFFSSLEKSSTNADQDFSEVDPQTNRIVLTSEDDEDLRNKINEFLYYSRIDLDIDATPLNLKEIFKNIHAKMRQQYKDLNEKQNEKSTVRANVGFDGFEALQKITDHSEKHKIQKILQDFLKSFSNFPSAGDKKWSLHNNIAKSQISLGNSALKGSQNIFYLTLSPQKLIVTINLNCRQDTEENKTFREQLKSQLSAQGITCDETASKGNVGLKLRIECNQLPTHIPLLQDITVKYLSKYVEQT